MNTERIKARIAGLQQMQSRNAHLSETALSTIRIMTENEIEFLQSLLPTAEDSGSAEEVAEAYVKNKYCKPTVFNKVLRAADKDVFLAGWNSRPLGYSQQQVEDVAKRACSYGMDLVMSTERGEDSEEESIDEILSSITPAGQTYPEWIPVEKQLPQIGQRIIFVAKCHNESSFEHGNVYGGKYTPDGSFSTPGCGLGATHWMPSPAPPSPGLVPTQPNNTEQ